MTNNDPETIFEKIIKKEIPAQIIFENEDAIAFHDIAPQAPVHVLVVPKTKIKNFSDLYNHSEATIGRYFKAINAVIQKLQLDSNGYRIVFNRGHHGQESVPYIHAHILAGRQLSWPPG